jgi:hypothetical protein
VLEMVTLRAAFLFSIESELCKLSTCSGAV